MPNIVNTQAVTEKILDCGWKSQRLVLGVKHDFGKKWLDVRKWAILGTGNIPKHGLLLDIELWPMVIKEIQAMIDNENTSINKEGVQLVVKE